MTETVASEQSSPFEYVLFEGNTDEMKTVTAPPYETNPWVDPSSLTLRHRIGRGTFGDVWLATHHQSTEDYDEYHEVAIKILSLVKEGNMKAVFDKLNRVFEKCQGVNSACQLRGFSVLNGKISIIMKFYEGSVGDKMAKLQGGRLPLHDVLYGISVAQAVMEVHSKEILILNLKPSNILLDESNHAILGDLGIPYLLLGACFSNPDMVHRLGTPNYMAPEQWDPELRGPISFETDSWGFGCMILEMLTGTQPWCWKSAKQIYNSVVINHERPVIPSGLPPAVKSVLSGCFEYDFRNRPHMQDITRAFQRTVLYDLSCMSIFSNFDCSSQEELPAEEQNVFLESIIITIQPAQIGGYTEWFLSKDHLQEGDIVRSRKSSNSCKHENMAVPEGKVVGLEEGFILVRVHGYHDPIRVHSSTLERVTLGFAAGDWVRLRAAELNRHSPVGLLHSIDRDGNVTVGFTGMQTLWKGKSSDLQMSKAYCVGQFVRPKPTVFSPRFEWPHKRGAAWAPGKIAHIHPNGCLVVTFPGRLPFWEKQSRFVADPAEVEAISFATSPGLVQKYQHLEDFHWAVGPLIISLGFFTAVKFGVFVGNKIIVRGPKGMKKDHQEKGGSEDGSNGSGNNNGWWRI
ncbi:hypothetical protein V2J09_022310 [Rumex salicifolius]